MFRVVARTSDPFAELRLRDIARHDGKPAVRRRGAAVVLTWTVYDYNAACGLRERLAEVYGATVEVKPQRT